MTGVQTCALPIYIVWANVTRDFVRFARASTDLVLTYKSPTPVREFILAFDSGTLPKPFTLRLTRADFHSIRPRRTGQSIISTRPYRTRREVQHVQFENGVSKKEAEAIVKAKGDVPVYDSNGVLLTPPPPKRGPVTSKGRRFYRETLAEAYAREGQR